MHFQSTVFCTAATPNRQNKLKVRSRFRHDFGPHCVIMRNSLVHMAVLLTVLFASPVAAEYSLMRDFAACTGRFSAEVEHSWLMQSQEADRKEALYRSMETLLASVTSADDAVQARAIRIEYKAAHSHLLLQSAFGWDAEQRAFSGRRAKELLGACSSFMLADAQNGSMKIWAIGRD